MAYEYIIVTDYLLPSQSTSSMSEYPHPTLPFLGETSVPQAPPGPIPQFALSPGPNPWRNYNRIYSPFPNVIANNFGTVGPQPPVSLICNPHFIPFLYEDGHSRQTDTRQTPHDTIKVASRPF